MISFLTSQDDLYEFLTGFSFAECRALPLSLLIIVLAHSLKNVIIFILFPVFQSAILFLHYLNEFVLLSCFFLKLCSRVASNCRIVLHSLTDKYFSSLKAAITMSSNGSENLAINLNKPLACPIFP